jgi:hypothetical protein
VLFTIRHSLFAIRRTARRSLLAARYLRSDRSLSRTIADVLFTIRHSLFAIRPNCSLLPLAISEVTRHCPEMLPLAFHHSPFAIRHSPNCSPLAARRSLSQK